MLRSYQVRWNALCHVPLELDRRCVLDVGPPQFPAHAQARVAGEGVRQHLLGLEDGVDLLRRSLDAGTGSVHTVAVHGEGSIVVHDGLAQVAVAAIAFLYWLFVNLFGDPWCGGVILVGFWLPDAERQTEGLTATPLMRVGIAETSSVMTTHWRIVAVATEEHRMSGIETGGCSKDIDYFAQDRSSCSVPDWVQAVPSVPISLNYWCGTDDGD
ncbi:hypothetical protein FOPE_02144 [Fonsecaea pedrosoi]|nr:hypothetical protein FOPE_02144 [Fonsecaea pedrosoi]